MLQQVCLSLRCRLGKEETLGHEPALVLGEGGQHRHGVHQDQWHAQRGERDDEVLDLGGGGTGTASGHRSLVVVGSPTHHGLGQRGRSWVHRTDSATLKSSIVRGLNRALCLQHRSVPGLLDSAFSFFVRQSFRFYHRTPRSKPIFSICNGAHGPDRTKYFPFHRSRDL